MGRGFQIICTILLLFCFSFILGEAGHQHGHTHDHSHDHNHPHVHDHSHSHSHKPVISLPEPTVLGGPWAWTFAATTIIGIAPIVVIVFVPIMETVKEKTRPKIWLLKRLLGFAVGGLLGDVFLHLLPHAAEGGHSHSHEDEGMSVPHDHSESTIQGLWILGGIIAFFLIEKYLRISSGAQGHSHSHSHAHDNKKNDDKNEKKKKNEKSSEKTEEQKKATAILNIVADMAHNFTDGMAIAGSFLVSYKLGMTTTFAVFIHEIPHEIGDYAILLQSGYEKSEAMKIQFYTAFGALLGALFGLITGGVADSLVTSFILPFTAGGFIYVACVNVIPELLETNSWGQTFWEVVSMCLGISLMVGIGQLEHTELF